jgi:hypothetical protein
MFKNVWAIIAAIIVCLANIAAADSGCNETYIAPGRQALFEGTLSGIREAYTTFDAGVHNSTCANDRELKFLHALTRIAMWGARDNGGQVDSAVELAREFGITVLGDYYSQLEVNRPPYPASSYGSYQMPAATPTVNGIRAQIFGTLLPGIADFAVNAAIPEIDSVIAELDSITETPSDRFRIFFYPAETGLKSNLEVDYADVLILKAGLMLLKSQLQTQIAYDTFTDANDIIIEKLCAGTLKIEDDLIGRYPNLLKVLPTPGHPADGNAILAQTKQDLIYGIDYYTAAVNYMLSEDDPQEDDLLSISPGRYIAKDKVDSELAAIRNNLTAGMPVTHVTSKTESYNIKDSSSNLTGNLILKYDALGKIIDGSFDFITSPEDYEITSWDIKNAQIDDFGFMAEMELSYNWGSGLLAGVMSADHKKISNITFEYWGDYEGNATELTAAQVSTAVETVQINLNKIYGTNPVNPRDILPDFDKWNMPKTGTFGNDPTLGGILPQFTQADWQKYLNLQPSGLFYLPEVLYPWQKRTYDGETFVGIWLDNQRVFVDPQGDTSNNPGVVNNIDIESLYLGYDDDKLYGSILCYNFNQYNENDTAYDIYLSYSPNNPKSLYSIQLYISTYGEEGEGYIYYMYNDGYETYWEERDSFPVHVGRGGVDFAIPWERMPDYLPGRFITLNSRGGGYDYEKPDGERNITHLQIGELGQISGTVTCNMSSYKGAPITIQAYTDPLDPKGSIVACTIIEQPGPYELDGIGLGWYGWVRATMPCYEFDTQGISSSHVENRVDVFVAGPDAENINLNLGACTGNYNYCAQATQLSLDVPRYGIVPYNGELWYYFVADTNAVFSVRFENVDSDFSVDVFDKCGGKKLISGNPWDELRLNAREGQTYYIRLKPGYGSDGFTVTLSYYGPGIINDRCETALEIVTDTNYSGDTTGAMQDGKSSCGNGDDYDVWFKFTPSADGVYQLDFTESNYDAVASVYDNCGGKELLCQELWRSDRKAYINLTAGTSYYIRFANEWSMTEPYALRVSFYGAGQTNDSCTSASVITEASVLAGSTLGALDGDIWYRFTPAGSGVYDINFMGWDSRITVFDECDGNEVPMGVSWPRYFKTEAGRTYLLRIQSIEGELGVDFTLQLIYAGTGPANDNKKNAIELQPGSTEGTTIRATKDGESVCDGTSVDVWYVLTPLKSGIYKIIFENSDSSASLGIFEPAWLGWTGVPAQIICQSSWDEHPAYFYARAGAIYYVRVAGYWEDTGAFTLRLDKVAEKSSASDLTGDNIVNQLDLDWFFYYWLASCPQPYWCGGADLNSNLIVNFEDFVELANNWMQTDLP